MAPPETPNLIHCLRRLALLAPAMSTRVRGHATGVFAPYRLPPTRRSGRGPRHCQFNPKRQLNSEYGSSLFSVETPVPLRDTTEHEKGIPLIINNLLLFSG